MTQALCKVNQIQANPAKEKPYVGQALCNLSPKTGAAEGKPGGVQTLRKVSPIRANLSKASPSKRKHHGRQTLGRASPIKTNLA